MIEIYFDGACGPRNPGGHAAYGWVIKRNKSTVATGCGYIGHGDGMTNNVAEYVGLLEAVKRIQLVPPEADIRIYGDSQLVCNMVSRKWGKHKGAWVGHRKEEGRHLQKYLIEILTILEGKNYRIDWIPRERNDEADELSKKPLKTKGVEQF